MKLSKLFFVALIAVAFAFLGCTPPPSINLCEKSADCVTDPEDWACDAEGAAAKITLIELDEVVADPDAEPPVEYAPPMLAMDVKGTAPTPGATYMLITYVPDDWPAYGLSCLSAPITADATTGEIAAQGAYVGPDLVDAKIWLVPIGDVICPVPGVSGGQMTGWDCDNLMFEVTADDLVNYDSPLDDPPPSP